MDTITIHRWMIDELGLKGYALLVYAILYQKTDGGKTSIKITAKKIGDMIGADANNAYVVIRALIDKGLIRKESGWGRTANVYYITEVGGEKHI